MYKNRCFFRPSGRIREILEIWNSKLDTFVQSGNWNSSRKTYFLQNTLCAGYPGFLGNRDIFGHFFPKCHNLQKKCKNEKTQKMQNVLKTPEILGVLSKIGLWRFVEALKKCRKWQNPVHTRTFFPKFREGHFGVFDFQLRIEVKFRKKAFSTFFGKIFTFFAFYRLEVDGPIFYKIWTSLFSKSAEHVFGFGSDFVLLLLRKSVRTKMTTPTDYPIGPLLRGSVFLTLFCSDSRLCVAQKSFVVLLLKRRTKTHKDTDNFLCHGSKP
jgi:hypothetical protein